MSSEEKELQLVGKVELRIALASTDSKLESLLKVYLAPLLLKLASPHSSVSNKVIEIADHIILRISNSSLKLPLATLTEQLKTNVSNKLIQTYDTIFILLALNKLLPDEKYDYLFTFLPGISHFYIPESIAILFEVLKYWRSPSRGSQDVILLRNKLQFDVHPEDAEFLSSLFIKIMLVDTHLLNSIPEPDPNSSDSRINLPSCYSPGLTSEDYFQINAFQKGFYTFTSITDIRYNILKFIDSGIFNDKFAFIPSLIATCDPTSKVNSLANDVLSRLHVDYEDETVINPLYDFFNGNSTIETADLPTRLPVSDSLKANILSFAFNKSIYAANLNPIQTATLGMTSSNKKTVKYSIWFVSWVSRVAKDEEMIKISSTLIQILKDYILHNGWPKLTNTGTEEIRQRSLAYETIGKICNRSLGLDSTNISIVSFLFSSLRGDDPAMRPSILEALSLVIPSLNSITPDAKSSLVKLLFSFIEVPPPDSSHFATSSMAVRYAIRVFPFSDPSARMICMLGTDKRNKSDCVDESEKGLHPYWYKILNPDSLGDSKDINPETNIGTTFPKLSEIYNLFTEHSNLIPIEVLTSSLKFMRFTLIMNALDEKIDIPLSQSWDKTLDKLIIYDNSARINLTNFIEKNQEETSTVSKVLNLLFDSFMSHPTELEHIGNYWLEFLSLAPSNVIKNWKKVIPQLKTFLLSSNSKSLTNVRTISNALGIISTHPEINDTEILDLINSLSDLNNKDKSELLNKGNNASVYLLSISFIISRLGLRSRLQVLPKELLKSYSDSFVSYLESNDKSIKNSAIESISNLAAFGAFAPSDDISKGLIEKYKEIIKAGNEQAMSGLGYLSLFFKQDDDLNRIADIIYDSHETKEVENSFTSGEALSIVAAGWDSRVLDPHVDVQGCPPLALHRFKFIEVVMNKVLSFESQTKPSLRRAGCLWLLSLVQYCGHLDQVKNHFLEANVAFMHYLSDRNDYVQESASQGLNIIYEKGSKSLKDELVNGLMRSFTGDDGKKLNAGTVSADTQLFDSHTLNTGEGYVSTYKDVMNLASEVGDPSLIYKFMSMASSSNLWAARKGAAFGLGAILSKYSIDDLISNDPSIANVLIPKLYRYRFDPYSSVRKAMNEIWKNLISNSSQTVKKYFDNILKELCAGIGNKEWRVRVASSNGLAELVQSAPIERYFDDIEKIWSLSFRAVDDINESVRVAGMNLSRALTNIFINSIDPEQSRSEEFSKSVLAKILPFLMGKNGLQSQVEEIQSFALDAILKVCKKAKSALKPYIKDLIINLIELMSTFEPQAFNYLSFHTDKYNITANDLDQTRLKNVRDSPMMDAIEQLIDELDPTIMPQLIPSLLNVIRRSIGLPSKLVGSRVIVTLFIRTPDLVDNYADELLKVTLESTSSSNDTVAASYSMACGYVAKYISSAAFDNLTKNLFDKYVSSETSQARNHAGLIIQSISKYAPEKFQIHANSLLSISYIGMHDPNTEVSALFKQVWDDNTGGSSAVRSYIETIIKSCSLMLKHTQWRVRNVAALTLVDASQHLDISNPNVETLLHTLMEASAGKVWDGKENVIDALCKLAVKNKSAILEFGNRQELLEKLQKIFTVEANKRNYKYARVSFGILCRFAHNFPNIELYDEIFKVSEKLLNKNGNDDDDDIEMIEEGTPEAYLAMTRRDEIYIEVINSLSASYYPILLNGNATKDSVLVKIIDRLDWALKNDSGEIDQGLRWQRKKSVSHGFHVIVTSFFESGEDGSLLPENRQNLLRKFTDEESNVLYKCLQHVMFSCFSEIGLDHVQNSAVIAAGILLLAFTRQNLSALANCVENLLNEKKTGASSIVLAQIEQVLKKT